MGMNIGGKTDKGLKRDTNQDFFRIDELSDGRLLMVVCDGMGGVVGGSEASSVAATTFCEYARDNAESTADDAELLLNAGVFANDAVCDKAQNEEELEGMGTTLVAALYDKEKYTFLWIGDSRIYAFNNCGMKQISHDHSFVQALIDSGNISVEEAKNHPNRNIITKAIGSVRGLTGDVSVMSAENVKGVLLCSDGLCGYVDEDLIEKVCLREKDAVMCTENLVDMAIDCGGTDNITVVVHMKD